MNNKATIIIFGGIVWYLIIGYLWFLANKHIRQNDRTWTSCTFPKTGGFIRFGFAMVIWMFICQCFGWLEIWAETD